MPTSRSRGQSRGSTSRSTSSTTNRSAATRPRTDVMLSDIQQRTNIPRAQFPSTPAAVYGPPSSATHAHLSGPISQAVQQQQQQQPAQSSRRQATGTTQQQPYSQPHYRQAPPPPSTSIHSSGYYERMEYQERERTQKAAEILGSRELLMRYAIMHNESIPQVRLRLQKQLVGIKHTPYNTSSSRNAGSSSSEDTRIIRDMRPEEDDGKGSWAENETVIGPGPLVQQDDTDSREGSGS